MAKVKKQFYSITQKRTYKVGEEISAPHPMWIEQGLVEELEDKNGKPKTEKKTRKRKTTRKK